eukprot:jgi/Tetstr1/430673/TSEL_020466.t1
MMASTAPSTAAVTGAGAVPMGLHRHAGRQAVRSSLAARARIAPLRAPRPSLPNRAVVAPLRHVRVASGSENDATETAENAEAEGEEGEETVDGFSEELPPHLRPSIYESSNEELNLTLSDAEPDDFLECKTIRHLLTPIESPFVSNNMFGGGFVFDADRVRLQSVQYSRIDSAGASCSQGVTDPNDGTCIPLPPFTMRAGPRKRIYFEPKEVTAAIITCGGLCPGLNDVVQNIVFTLTDYGVPEDQILGIRNGLMGLYDHKTKPLHLTRRVVDGIQLRGGTILGTSRGGAAKIPRMVDRLDLWGINMVFVVGGNGGNAAASAIHNEVEKRGLKMAVVGVPKSIDNDILLIDRCFGYQTAVEESQRALLAAKVEASSAKCGLGIVKLMGRQSGFIAMEASMASGVVDLCLIPETKFSMDKVAAHVQSIIDKKGHAVICVAEGAGQDIMEDASSETDASGNPILGDIGTYMKTYLKQHLKEADIKYIDPTYMIRAIPTGAPDRVYCKALGQSAVHGAFAGFTDVSVGMVNTHMAILPIPVIIQAAKIVNVHGSSWNRLRQTIRQPDLI